MCVTPSLTTLNLSVLFPETPCWWVKAWFSDFLLLKRVTIRSLQDVMEYQIIVVKLLTVVTPCEAGQSALLTNITWNSGVSGLPYLPSHCTWSSGSHPLDYVFTWAVVAAQCFSSCLEPQLHTWRQPRKAGLSYWVDLHTRDRVLYDLCSPSSHLKVTLRVSLNLFLVALSGGLWDSCLRIFFWFLIFIGCADERPS